jgi:hypothetical protein
MKETIRIFALAFLTAVMMEMPCMAQDAVISVWKRLLDMAAPQMAPCLSRECGCVALPDQQKGSI